MSIHNETMDKTTVIKVEGSEPSVSQEPVPPGTYPCVVIKSSYDETSRECVYDADQMLVRPVRDNKTGIESPVTPEERSKGFSVHPSGTYIWLLLKVTTPDVELPKQRLIHGVVHDEVLLAGYQSDEVMEHRQVVDEVSPRRPVNVADRRSGCAGSDGLREIPQSEVAGAALRKAHDSPVKIVAA